MKTTSRYRAYIITLITTLCMSFVMSFVIVLTIEGFRGHFSNSWIRSSLYAFVVGYPTALIITTIAERVVDKFIK
jgi:Protein of unknown function (DUF2798)